LGVYPVIKLSDARRKADEARIQISNNIDPSTIRKDAKASIKLTAENERLVNAGLLLVNSFEDLARQWLASTAHKLRDITHNKKISRFELHVFPLIGDMELSDIKSPNIFSLVKPLFNKLETAHRVHNVLSDCHPYSFNGLADAMKDIDLTAKEWRYFVTKTEV
jgi:hypothetical protein